MLFDGNAAVGNSAESWRMRQKQRAEVLIDVSSVLQLLLKVIRMNCHRFAAP